MNLPITEQPRISPLVSQERFSEDEMAQIKHDVSLRLVEAFDGANNSEIARRLKTIPATVRQYTNGSRLPIGEFLIQIHRATGINLHWLLTGNGPRRVVDTSLFTDAEDDQIRAYAREKGLSFDEAVRQLALAAMEFKRLV